MYENIVVDFTSPMTCEDIVPDLSPSACKSTRVGDGIPILEAAPYLFRYDPREIRDQQEWLNALAVIQRR